jgi:hypothetical protein
MKFADPDLAAVIVIAKGKAEGNYGGLHSEPFRPVWAVVSVTVFLTRPFDDSRRRKPGPGPTSLARCWVDVHAAQPP